MSNSKIAIITDSTANLPDDIIAKYNIHVVPLTVNWGGQSYLDGIDITPAAFYERLATDKESPTTSQPSAGQFEEVFSKLAESYESIVGVFVSEPLSGTLDSARTAHSTMPDFPIEIIDSRSISFGLGYMVLAAARAAEERATVERRRGCPQYGIGARRADRRRPEFGRRAGGDANRAVGPNLRRR
jgi:DegV family protein with EDD domain